MRADRSTVAWALVASLGAHVFAMSALPVAPVGVVTHHQATLEPFAATDGPDGTVATRETLAPMNAPPPTVGGPDAAQNVDAPDTGGGGAPSDATVIITLVSRPDTMTLTSRIANAAEANQMQRIRTARSRATPWQGRATPSPEDAPFLASGEGERRERRAPDPREAAAGVRAAGARTARGAAPGGAVAGAGSPTEVQAAGAAAGRERAHAGAGVSAGTGHVATTRANVAHARPTLDQGLPTVHAPVIYELPRDTVDSEALTSRLTQSFVDTSRRASRTAGEGSGGGSGVSSGSGGGAGVGGRSTPYAPGPGSEGTLDLASGRYRSFYLSLRREVERHLTFPRERARNLDQGHAVFRLTLRRDGSLARPPVLVRSTGFDDLDAASQRAIELARFEAVPEDLSPGAATVSIRMSVVSSNPVVR